MMTVKDKKKLLINDDLLHKIHIKSKTGQFRRFYQAAMQLLPDALLPGRSGIMHLARQ